MTAGSPRTSAIPEDYGGVHDVIVSDKGAPLAQGGVEVTQTFEMHPAEGPIGTPIELRVTGLGWRTMESTWVMNWDNQEVGWVSATDTRGTAIARFRATGTVGDHQLKVLHRLHGPGLPESRAGAERVPAAPGVRLSRDPGSHGAVRGTSSRTRRSRCPRGDRRSERGAREHRAGAGTRPDARDAQRRGFPANAPVSWSGARRPEAACRAMASRRRNVELTKADDRR